ncbi:TIGR00645 family protein [soil metagenome]
MNPAENRPSARVLGRFIFLSRWLQAPLYVGLIVTQLVYVYQFFLELIHLVIYMYLGKNGEGAALTEQDIMIKVLTLIDVVMIANLLVMVIVGGYETFVSRLRLEGHPDQPEWLSHVNAGVLKVKLATALIGISSIHLLRSFIELGTARTTYESIMWQVIVHLTFVVSALILAFTDRISTMTAAEVRKGH